MRVENEVLSKSWIRLHCKANIWTVSWRDCRHLSKEQHRYSVSKTLCNSSCKQWEANNSTESVWVGQSPGMIVKDSLSVASHSPHGFHSQELEPLKPVLWAAKQWERGLKGWAVRRQLQQKRWWGLDCLSVGCGEEMIEYTLCTHPPPNSTLPVPLPLYSPKRTGCHSGKLSNCQGSQCVCILMRTYRVISPLITKG